MYTYILYIHVWRVYVLVFYVTAPLFLDPFPYCMKLTLLITLTYIHVYTYREMMCTCTYLAVHLIWISSYEASSLYTTGKKIKIYRKNRKLCVDFIRAIRAGSGLPHNKKLVHLHFLYTKIHINAQKNPHNINSGCVIHYNSQ